mgnify:CR=1 FL=1
MKTKRTFAFMTQAAIIAALYAALTLVLAPIGFGPFQCRVSEALTILAAFTPAAIPGLSLGCLISNAIGLVMGLNPTGAIDMIFGTAATLLAAICSYLLRNIRWFSVPVLSTLPPVIFNILIIGAELSYVLHIPYWLAAFVEVGIGEFIACCVIGIPLSFAIVKFGLEKFLQKLLS